MRSEFVLYSVEASYQLFGSVAIFRLGAVGLAPSLI
jgi:hypothetical protein